MPLSKKITLSTNNAIQRDQHDDCQWFLFLFVIMMPNTIGTITKAIRHNNYSLVFLCVSVFICFFLLQFCLTKYISLPKNEKSSLKFWLKLNMWFLYTIISYGFVYQFADFFPPNISMALYSLVLVCSSFLFYLFVIVDLVKYWKISRNGGNQHWKHENETLEAGKLNYYSVSIWEKV